MQILRPKLQIICKKKNSTHIAKIARAPVQLCKVVQDLNCSRPEVEIGQSRENLHRLCLCRDLGKHNSFLHFVGFGLFFVKMLFLIYPSFNFFFGNTVSYGDHITQRLFVFFPI